jgi:hypothetical protein
MKKIDFKKLKPVPKMQDPIRYPKVTGKIEEESKRDFTRSLSLESKMLIKMMDEIIH